MKEYWLFPVLGVHLTPDSGGEQRFVLSPSGLQVSQVVA